MLIVLAGLPGVGKSTLAAALAPTLGATWLRIDTIEGALARLGIEVDVHGYTVAYAIAADQLRLGGRVVADAVNPVAQTRAAWRALRPTLEVELVCSDERVHRRRIAARPHVRWRDVATREYAPHDADVVIDTAVTSRDDAVGLVLQALGEAITRGRRGR